MKIINKPWGKEELLCCNDKYAGKLLYINKGHRLSKQYHEKKHETLYLLSGKAEVSKNDRAIIMMPQDTLEIKPRDIHRIKAIEDCIFIEFSSPELKDVVRISDDYYRV